MTPLVNEQRGDEDKGWLDLLRSDDARLLHLDLEGYFLGDDGATDLAEALKNNHHLTSLNLSDNGLTCAATEKLSECLKENASLTELWLQHNDIGDSGAVHLADALLQNSSLKVLRFGPGNALGQHGAEAMCSMLVRQTKPGLQGLSMEMTLAMRTARVQECLAKCCLNSLKICSFQLECAGSLLLNTCLTALEISSPGTFTCAHACSLAKQLQSNTTLTSLELSFNKGLGDVGATHLARSLHVNTTLRDLRMHCCSISDDGAKAFADGLTVNSTLQVLGLGNLPFDFGFDEQGIDYHHEAVVFKMNPGADSRIGVAGMLAIGQALAAEPRFARGHFRLCEGVKLCMCPVVALATGLPKRAVAQHAGEGAASWTNERALSYLGSRWEEAMLAFAGGTHERLGVDSPVLALARAPDCMLVVNCMFWGLRQDSKGAPRDVFKGTVITSRPLS